MGRFQVRLGPNRVGPLGLGQALADAIKLLFKENIVQSSADKFLFYLAPAVVVFTAIVTFSAIPFGEPFEVGGAENRAVGGEPQYRSPVHLRCFVDGHLRDRPRGTFVEQQIFADGRFAFFGADDQLRIDARPVGLVRGDHEWLAQLVRYCERAKVICLCDSPVSGVRLVFYFRSGGNQPGAVRFAGSGAGVGRRIFHRVFGYEVRHVLHGRVCQHDHHERPDYDSVSGRMELLYRSGYSRFWCSRSKYFYYCVCSSGCGRRFPASGMTG